MIYYCYFHSVMTYGLLFWGHLSDSIKIFRLHKKIIRIMMDCRNSDSRRKLFFSLENSPFASQHILSLLLLMIKNRNQFVVNSVLHHIDTRQHANFHQPYLNFTKYQKGVYQFGVKVFNMLPSYIQIQSDNPKIFKLILHKFLYENSFHCLDAYFELQQKLNSFINDLNQYLKVWHIKQIYI